MVRLGRMTPRRATRTLIVCTGNVCRSPYITTLLADAVPMLAVRSAGTAALAGSPPTDEVLDALHAQGLSGDDHVARQLTRGMVRNSRLVITATRAHRLAVTDLSADAATRAFTLKELARLLSNTTDTDTDLDTMLGPLAAVGHAEVVDHDDDLADPYGLGPAAYDQMFREVGAALAVIGPALAGVTT